MLNNTTLVGRLTKDPIIRNPVTDTGKPIANITVAFDTNVEETSFIDAVLFGKQAEVAGKNLHKGDKVGIAGRLHQRKYQRKDGSTGSVIEILVNDIEFLTPKKDGETVKVPDEEFPPEEKVEIPEGYHMDEDGNLIKDKPSKKK